MTWLQRTHSDIGRLRILNGKKKLNQSVTKHEKLSQKQREQYRSYVAEKLNETWIEQVDEMGKIFVDSKLNPQCEFIKIIKKDATDSN